MLVAQPCPKNGVNGWAHCSWWSSTAPLNSFFTCASEKRKKKINDKRVFACRYYSTKEKRRVSKCKMQALRGPQTPTQYTRSNTTLIHSSISNHVLVARRAGLLTRANGGRGKRLSDFLGLYPLCFGSYKGHHSLKNTAITATNQQPTSLENEPPEESNSPSTGSGRSEEEGPRRVNFLQRIAFSLSGRKPFI